MEKKEPIKISLSTFFLFLAIILIIIMGYFIYKLYNEKSIATQEIADLNNKISTSENTVNNFQEKIDSISNTINSNKAPEVDNTQKENEFVKTVGSAWGQIFVKQDNTIYSYNEDTKEYTQIKDENDKSVKMKDIFLQWSTTYNDLVKETGGDDRIFVITEDNKLLYLNGYSSVIAKEYKDAIGKTVKSTEKQKQDTEYSYITNLKVTFTDETKLVIKDIQGDNN